MVIYSPLGSAWRVLLVACWQLVLNMIMWIGFGSFLLYLFMNYEYLSRFITSFQSFIFHYFTSITGYIICVCRRLVLEQRLASSQVTREEQINLIKDLERKETEYMRLKRHRICVDDFEMLTIIGRGAFGEVCTFQFLQACSWFIFCSFIFLAMIIFICCCVTQLHVTVPWSITSP